MEQQLEKYFQGLLDEHEKVAFLKQVKSDEKLKAMYMKYQNELALLSFSDDVINKKESKSNYELFLRKERKKKIYKTILQSVKYAAILIIVFLSARLYHIYFYLPHVSVTETTLYVPPSQRIQITLQDGTEVWLNAQTRITYPSVFSDKERRVMVEGEAFFKVAKDEDRPFIVTSNGTDLRVLGTEFNLYAYPEEAEHRVSLLEGSLEIAPRNADLGKVILKPNEEAYIQDDKMEVVSIQDTDYFLWRDGIYSFTNEKLGDILKKLELYYDIDIVVKNPSILDCQYTVKFRQRDGIDEILRLLQRIHSFSINKNEEENIITIT